MDAKIATLQSNFCRVHCFHITMPKYGVITSSGYLSTCASPRSNDYRCFLIVVKAQRLVNTSYLATPLSEFLRISELCFALGCGVIGMTR